MKIKRAILVTISLAVFTASVQAQEDQGAGKYFDYQGYKVFYVEAGKGEPMIFLHNGGTSHRIWANQLRHFSRKYHVYAMDNLGFGQSDKPDIDYPLELHINQLKAFIEHLGIDKVILVGHCMGGAMALNYTARYPEKVKKLILLNVYTEQTLLSGILAEKYRALSSDSAALKQAVEEAKKAPPKNTHSNDPMAQVALTRVIARADTYGMSDRLKLPTNMPPILLLWGEQNPVLKCEAGKALRDRLRPQTFLALPNCKHMAMLEDPESFNQAMESFLGS